MVQNKHLYGSKQKHGSKQTLTRFKTNTYVVQNKHMVQNKHLYGSKQTLIWFKTNIYIVQNKHLYGAVQHDCVLFNSNMFRSKTVIIRP